VTVIPRVVACFCPRLANRFDSLVEAEAELKKAEARGERA
jgi:hypothetical protein